MTSRFVLPYADVGSGITPEDGAQLFFFEPGTNTPKDTYTDETLATPNTNPVIANANGVFPDIWISGSYKVNLEDKNNVPQTPGEWDPVLDVGNGGSITVDINGSTVNLESYLDSVDVASYDDFRNDTNGFDIASTPPGTTVNFTNDGIWGPGVVKAGASPADNGGTIIRSSIDSNRYWERSDKLPVTPFMFEAAGDGISNDTSSLTNFFQYCIDNTAWGHISAGTYLITLGSLAFDNAHVTTKFPKITTDSHEAVIFTNAADTDAAFLSFTNGTAVSGAGKFWEVGELGGITFQRVTGSAANTAQHGLVIRGFNYCKFGLMGATSIGGNGIHIPQLLFGGTNPDPYHINGCEFAGIEANFCDGYAFLNDNFVGMSLCAIRQIRAIENGGVFFGMGAGNSIEKISAGSNAGYGVGDDVAATGGAANRFLLEFAEFDDQQFGINAGRVTNSDFGVVRFVHRYNFGPLNPSGGYWPETALDIGATSASDLNFECINRIESGGTKPEIGIFTDYNNTGGNIGNIKVHHKILDNAGFGFDDSDQYTNYNSNSLVMQTGNNGRQIIDNLGDNSALARSPTTYAVPNTGFGTNVVEFSTELRDTYANYDPTTYEYTVPSTGLYEVSCTLTMSLTAGDRVRVGTLLNSAGQGGKNYYAAVTGVNSFDYEYSISASAGDTISITADQNTGGAVNLTTVLGANDNYLSLTRVAK